MAFDLMAGGHRFDFFRGVCVKCEMTHEYFEHNGSPYCTGKPPEKKKPIFPPDDVQ